MDIPFLQTYDIFGRPKKQERPKLPKPEEPFKLIEQLRAKRVPYFRPEEITPKRWETLSWWEKPIDILMRPSYAAVGLVTGVIKGEDPLGRAAKGFLGEKPYTFTEELFKESPWYIKYPLGLGLDIVTDPVTYVTAGSIKAMSMSSKGVSKAVPPVIRLSELGTKQYRNIEAALATTAGLKNATPKIAEEAHDVMRYLVERPIIERAKDAAGLTRFDREIGSIVPEQIRRLRETGVIAEIADASKLLDPKGLRLSIPLLRRAIGEPMILPGAAAEKALAVPGAILGAAWKGAKKVPGVGTVAKMTELAAESATQGLKGWFKQINDYAAMDDILNIADAEIAKDLKSLTERTKLGAKQFEDLVAKTGGDREVAKNAYRDVMTNIETTMQTLPDTEKIHFFQKRIADLNAKYETGEAVFKKKTMKMTERRGKLEEIAAKLGDADLADPLKLAERIGFTEFKGGRWIGKEVEKRAAGVARQEQAIEREAWKDMSEATYGPILSEMDVPAIRLGKETTKKMRGLYGALPPQFRTTHPKAVTPDELAAMLADRGFTGMTFGEEALEKYVEMLAATGRMRMPGAKPPAKNWYHGSGTSDIKAETINPLQTEPDSLFGMGFYMTDDPIIASSYARTRARPTGARPTVYKAKTADLNILNVDRVASAGFSNIAKRATSYLPDEIADEVLAVIARHEGQAQSTVEALFSDIRRAITEASSDLLIPKYEFSAYFSEIIMQLRRAGYDAIAYKGGKLTGGKPHNVLILLDPNDILTKTGRTKQVTSLTPVSPEQAQKVAKPPTKEWWPKHLRGRPVVTTEHRMKAAQEMVAEQISRTTAKAGERGKVMEARWTKQRGELERRIAEHQSTIQNATKTVPHGRGLTAEEIIAARTAEGVELPQLTGLDPELRKFIAEDRKLYDDFFGKLEQLDKGAVRREGYLPLQMTPMLRNAWINAFDELGIKDRVLRLSASGQHARHRMTQYTIDQGALIDWYKANRLNPEKLSNALKKAGFAEDQINEVRLWLDDPVELLHRYTTSVTRVVHREKLRNTLIEKFASHKLNPDDPEFFNLANRILFEEKDSALFMRVRQAPGLEIDAVALSRATPEDSFQKLVSLKDKIVDKTVYVIPEEIKDAVTKLYQVTRSDTAWNGFLRNYDGFLGLWKAIVTILFPSFHSRNIGSNSFMLYIGGIAVDAVASKMFKGFTLFRLWNKKAADKLDLFLVKSPTGVTYTGRQVLDEMDRRGLLRTLMDQELQEINRVMAASDRPTLQAANKFFKVGQIANEYVDNSAKVALFVDQIEKGADFAAAAQHVRIHLYGPQRLTDMEKNVFRRLIPFYAWMRFSIPFAVHTLAHHPGQFAVVGKALNVAKKEEEALDKSAVPDWIASSAGVEVKKEGKTHYFFVLENWLPTADILKFGNTPQEFLSALSPAIRVPIELATNVSAADMKELERFSGEKKRFLGTAMNAKAVQILRNIRILNEVDRLMFRPELSITDRLAATIGGFRLYPVDEEYAYKRVLYEKQKEGSNIRQAMNRIGIQLGTDHPEYLELAERLSQSKQEQKDIRQKILKINPESFKREKVALAQ